LVLKFVLHSLYQNNKIFKAMTQVTTNQLKASIISYVNYIVKANTTGNRDLYEGIADTTWREEIKPFVINEEITTWESDIKKKFIDQVYLRFSISEKQAYCLARAWAAINPSTITA
jgi:hypothetical protein